MGKDGAQLYGEEGSERGMKGHQVAKVRVKGLQHVDSPLIYIESRVIEGARILP